jgi:hypothetical protein
MNAGIAVLERGDGDHPQLARADHREAGHDVMEVVRLPHPHGGVIGVLVDARPVAVEVRGVAEVLHHLGVRVAE